MKNYSRGGKDKGYSIHLPHIDKELMAYISSRPNWYAIAEVAKRNSPSTVVPALLGNLVECWVGAPQSM